QALFLARDRIGKKPLYYTSQNGFFVFASEIKSILQCHNIQRKVDPDALDALLTFGYIPAPKTLFKNIFALSPARFISLRIVNHKLQMTGPMSYWQPKFKTDQTLTAQEYETETLRLLKESVKFRLMSDVPLGAFLSGGIDSSTIVALMAELSDKPVKTFSIGFQEEEYNELPYARRVAQHFKTDHHELIIKKENVEELLPALTWHYDEGFADSSALPTYFVSRMTREHVKVALSGDGGDELFAGYGSYQG
ncbi:unnamed protein product, partial [marine sediment metagenome]